VGRMTNTAVPHAATTTEPLRRWARENPLPADAVLASALLLLSLVTSTDGPAVLLLVVPALALLLVRRQYPVAVAVTLTGVTMLAIAAGYLPLGLVVALGVAQYTLGLYRDLRIALPVGVGLLFGVPVLAVIADRLSGGYGYSFGGLGVDWLATVGLGCRC
jgi:hypothetical protein